MTSMSIIVPSCAAPDQYVRVPGHGSARLLVVPTVTSIVQDVAHFPAITIHGSGFACGATEVIFISGPVAAAQVTLISCDQISVAVQPASGSEIRVRTAGGTSAGFAMP